MASGSISSNQLWSQHRGYAQAMQSNRSRDATSPDVDALSISICKVVSMLGWYWNPQSLSAQFSRKKVVGFLVLKRIPMTVALPLRNLRIFHDQSRSRGCLLQLEDRHIHHKSRHDHHKALERRMVRLSWIRSEVAAVDCSLVNSTHTCLPEVWERQSISGIYASRAWRAAVKFSEVYIARNHQVHTTLFFTFSSYSPGPRYCCMPTTAAFGSDQTHHQQASWSITSKYQSKI